MPDPVLSIRDLEAGYRPSLPILHGISLEVFEGEIVTVLGPNGSGKSTLVKAVAGLVRIMNGSISFEGRNITGMETHELIRARVAYVPQSDNVFARLSVKENLVLGALCDPGESAGRMNHVLGLFPDLADACDLAVGKLSGGQRQMVAVGRALMASPRLLMVDEPSVGLAGKFARQVFGQLLRVKESGVAVLMVEQNARAALEISDRGYVLAEGRQKIHGTAANLLRNPEIGALYLGARSRLARQ